MQSRKPDLADVWQRMDALEDALEWDANMARLIVEAIEEAIEQAGETPFLRAKVDDARRTHIEAEERLLAYLRASP